MALSFLPQSLREEFATIVSKQCVRYFVILLLFHVVCMGDIEARALGHRRGHHHQQRQTAFLASSSLVWNETSAHGNSSSKVNGTIDGQSLNERMVDIMQKRRPFCPDTVQQLNMSSYFSQSEGSFVFDDEQGEYWAALEDAIHRLRKRRKRDEARRKERPGVDNDNGGVAGDGDENNSESKNGHLGATVLFIAGVEGTGHHLHHSVYKSLKMEWTDGEIFAPYFTNSSALLAASSTSTTSASGANADTIAMFEYKAYDELIDYAVRRLPHLQSPALHGNHMPHHHHHHHMHHFRSHKGKSSSSVSPSFIEIEVREDDITNSSVPGKNAKDSAEDSKLSSDDSANGRNEIGYMGAGIEDRSPRNDDNVILDHDHQDGLHANEGVVRVMTTERTMFSYPYGWHSHVAYPDLAYLKQRIDHDPRDNIHFRVLVTSRDPRSSAVSILSKFKSFVAAAKDTRYEYSVLEFVDMQERSLDLLHHQLQTSGVEFSVVPYQIMRTKTAKYSRLIGEKLLGLSGDRLENLVGEYTSSVSDHQLDDVEGDVFQILKSQVQHELEEKSDLIHLDLHVDMDRAPLVSDDWTDTEYYKKDLNDEERDILNSRFSPARCLQKWPLIFGDEKLLK